MPILFHSDLETFRIPLSLVVQRGLFIFFVLFFFLGHSITAQNEPLQKKATLIAQKEPLENILSLITKQTGVRFSYNSQLIDPKTKVSINVQNKSLKEILTVILPSSVSYKKVGEHIVFFKEKGERKKNQENLFSDNGNMPVDCLDSISLTKNEEMKAYLAGLILTTTAAAAAAPVFAQDTIPNEVQHPKTIIVEEKKLPEENLILLVAETNPSEENLIPLVAKEDSNVTTPKNIPVQLTFIYPLGTGWVKSAEKMYHLSVNVLGGVTGQIKGIEVGGLYNINKYGAKGVQFAGIFNATGAKDSTISSNAQFAGIFNYVQKGKSVQFAGIFNIGDTAHFQAAGIWNYAKQGKFQAAGIFNASEQSYFQAAGIVNITKQGAFQGAGIANVAEKSSCQIAGILNITKKGRFQMGLINVRDTADGVSLGLINIVKKGGILEGGIEAGEFVHTALTFRSGVQRLYTIISVGYNYTEKFWSVGSGLGTSFKLVGNLGLNLELTHATLYSTDSFWGWYSLTQFSPQLNYRFVKHFKMYVGPSLNLCVQSDWLESERSSRLVKTPYSFYNRTFNNTTFDMWVGVVGGVKF